MIQNIDIDLSPLAPGEERDISVKGDGPFTISLSCFVLHPPPPGYRGCPECTTQTANAGQSIRFRTPRRLAGGRLIVRITDAVGETEELSIDVLARKASSGAMGAAGA
jgi:hypothetical protein